MSKKRSAIVEERAASVEEWCATLAERGATVKENSAMIAQLRALHEEGSAAIGKCCSMTAEIESSRRQDVVARTLEACAPRAEKLRQSVGV